MPSIQPLPVALADRPLAWTLDMRVAMVAVLVCVALRAGADLWLADAIVRFEGGHFAWRHAPVLAQGVHVGGRVLSIVAWCAVVAGWAVLRLRGRAPELRRRLACVALAVLASTVLIALWKARSGVACPWDLTRYGGLQPWHAGFVEGPGRCFPAGHAGAGYAWLVLGPAARGLGVRVERAGWAIGLGAGLLFGIAQQLRGAHFASHDVAAALVCWLVARGVVALGMPAGVR